MTYEAHRLPQLWTMVEADDGSAAAYHLNTWERQITLLSEQSKRLKDLRADLVERWPPEQSDASFAFVSRVTEMINAMDQTVDDSVRVRTGLKQVADALESARKQLAPLLAQYDDKAAAWRSLTHGAFPELPVSLLSGASIIPGADDYVMQANQRRLDEQGREIMRAADKIVTEAQVALSGHLPNYERYQPPMHSPLLVSNDGSGSFGRSGYAGGKSPSGRQFVPAPQFDPPPPPLDQGPILAGHQPQPGPAILTPTQVNRDGFGRGTVPSVVGGARPIANISEQPLHGASPDQPVSQPAGVVDGSSSTFEAGPSNHATSPAVIGGMSGVASRGREAHGTAPIGRLAGGANVGRVIEGSGAPMPMSSAGGWRDRQYEEYVKRRQQPIVGDPDSPWPVAEGIPPVVECPPEHRHDVGPGVIGIDR